VKQIRKYDRECDEAAERGGTDKFEIEQNKIGKAQIQHQAEEYQRQRARAAYPQVLNFSETVNRANAEKDERNKTLRRGNGTLPEVSTATYMKTQGRPGSGRSDGSMGSRGSRGGHSDSGSDGGMGRYKTMNLGYDSSVDENAPL